MNANGCRIGIDLSKDQTRYEHRKPTLEPLYLYCTASKYRHEETDVEKDEFENISKDSGDVVEDNWTSDEYPSPSRGVLRENSQLWIGVIEISSNSSHPNLVKIKEQVD